jgi:hypothetical protein
MSTQAAEQPAITDDEIRAWARAAGKTFGERGRLPASLRAEYEQHLTELGSPPPPLAAGADGPGDHAAPGPARGPESHAEPPKAARAESTPRKIPPASRGGFLGRARALFGPAPPVKGKARAKAAPKDRGPRQPVTDFIARGYAKAGEWLEDHLNPPVGRCMQWQADYAGVIAEDLVPNTPVDRALQVLQTAKGRWSAAGAVIMMPALTYAMQLPGNESAFRQGLIREGMESCIAAQLDYFGTQGVADKLEAARADRKARQEEIDKIMNLIWIPPEGTPERAEWDRQQAAMAAQAQAAQTAAAAAAGMAPPAQPGPNWQAQGLSPDMRGEVVQMPAARHQRMRVDEQGKLVPE